MVLTRRNSPRPSLRDDPKSSLLSQQTNRVPHTNQLRSSSSVAGPSSRCRTPYTSQSFDPSVLSMAGPSSRCGRSTSLMNHVLFPTTSTDGRRMTCLQTHDLTRFGTHVNLDTIIWNGKMSGMKIMKLITRKFWPKAFYRRAERGVSARHWMKSSGMRVCHHRSHGPAVEHDDGMKSWYYKGTHIFIDTGNGTMESYLMEKLLKDNYLSFFP